MNISSKKYKYIIALTLVIVLSLIGVSYSAWTDNLSIKGKITTGNFNIQFAEGKDIVVDLVTVDRNNIIFKENISNHNVIASDTAKEDNIIKINIKDDLLSKLETKGYMLRVRYPLKATEDSHIKDVKPTKLSFNSPDDNLSVIPTSIQVTVEGGKVDLGENINKEDYKVNFNIYKHTKVENNKNYAFVYIEAEDINTNSKEINIEYKDLIKALAKGVDIDPDNPVIVSKLEAEYFLDIPISLEQYNDDK